MSTRGASARLRIAGGRVEIRPVAPSDRPGYLSAFERLSSETRYLRFATPKPRLTAREIAYLVDVDHRDHEALVAIDLETGRGVGVARFVRLPEAPDCAEVAVTVVDDWQGRGLGPALLERLAEHAPSLGVRRLRASVLAENRRALRLLARAGFRRLPGEGGMVTFERAARAPGRELRAAADGAVPAAA